MTTKRAMTCAALGAAALAGAIPALTAAQTTGGQDITVREQVLGLKFVRSGARPHGDRLATGDRVVSRQAMFDAAGQRTGTLFTDCVNVGTTARVFSAHMQCTATYRFSAGELVAVGETRLGPSARLAIAGGTGAYWSARGEVTTGARQGRYDVDVIHLDG